MKRIVFGIVTAGVAALSLAAAPAQAEEYRSEPAQIVQTHYDRDHDQDRRREEYRERMERMRRERRERWLRMHRRGYDRDRW